MGIALVRRGLLDGGMTEWRLKIDMLSLGMSCRCTAENFKIFFILLKPPLVCEFSLQLHLYR